MTILLILAALAFLVIWTACVARVVERRSERQIAQVRDEVEALVIMFAQRWDHLDKAVSEGLKHLEPEPPAPQADDRRLFVERSVSLCAAADAVVAAYSDTRGYAVTTKVGQC